MLKKLLALIPFVALSLPVPALDTAQEAEAKHHGRGRLHILHRGGRGASSCSSGACAMPAQATPVKAAPSSTPKKK